MRSQFLFFAAISGFIGVAMGAFGAHGLKSVLDADMLAVYKTAVMYQLWHSLGLGLIAVFQLHAPTSKRLIQAGWAMLIGIVLFSGSLYLLALSGIKGLGMITPFGGLAFLAAWALLAIFAYGASNSE